jgi:hypothetical protein
MEHAPQLSIWPILVGLAITLIAIGILATWIAGVLGVVLLLYSLWSWSQENRAGEEMHAVAIEAGTEEHSHE